MNTHSVYKRPTMQKPHQSAPAPIKVDLPLRESPRTGPKIHICKNPDCFINGQREW
jgi:hypothetical protein